MRRSGLGQRSRRPAGDEEESACRSSASTRRGCTPRRTTCTPTSSRRRGARPTGSAARSPGSEEHTSELQSRQYLVCRLLVAKKRVQRSVLPEAFALTILGLIIVFGLISPTSTTFRAGLVVVTSAPPTPYVSLFPVLAIASFA